MEGKFVYNQIEGYIQDNWRVNNKLTLDYGLRFTHQQPQYDANGQASNFFLDSYTRVRGAGAVRARLPGQRVAVRGHAPGDEPATGQLMGPGTAALIGQIVPSTGNLTNGIVRAGDGISKYNYEWPALARRATFRRRLRRDGTIRRWSSGAAWGCSTIGRTAIRSTTSRRIRRPRRTRPSATASCRRWARAPWRRASACRRSSTTGTTIRICRSHCSGTSACRW